MSRGISHLTRGSASGFGGRGRKARKARADVSRRPQRWRSWQAELDQRRLVFIDETWIKTNMAPLRDWGPKGAHLRGLARLWRTLTFLGALPTPTHSTLRLRRANKWRCFRAYVEHLLLPTLREDDIVILDSLGSHTSKAARQLIQAARARLWYLLQYSPDLTRSSRPSPRSSIGCGKTRSAPSRTLSDTSVTSSTTSSLASAPTTSPTPVMLQSRCETL